jgi:hypothetical protein
MFLIEKYNDGSASYGYEAGDKVILQNKINLHSLHGPLIKTYQAGEIVTITGRSYSLLIPGITAFYYFNNESEMQFAGPFEPADLETLREKPKAYIIPWYEGKMWKYSLVAARSAEEAKQICFKTFMQERMKGIKITKPFEPISENWKSDGGWISIHYLP